MKDALLCVVALVLRCAEASALLCCVVWTVLGEPEGGLLSAVLAVVVGGMGAVNNLVGPG